jgi:glycosyltransferase involved in cell wall biosynthesis
MGVPLIIDHWHGFTRLNFKRKLICRFLGRFTDLSLAVSQGVRTYVMEQCGLAPAKVRVVPNAVDCALFQRGRPAAEVRRELGLPLDLPVIVSEVGGLPEVVRHEENGLLVPVGDAGALAQGLASLLADPAWAQALGAQARRDVETHYSLNRLSRDVNAIYEELVEKKFGEGL